MKIANEITKAGASTKRMTQWKGMTVGFNKAKTDFFQIENLGGHDANGGHVADVRMIELSQIECEELLATWRAGKTAWYQKMAGLPLRRNAERASQIAVNKAN